MYICFTDESGTPEFRKSNEPFVLAGVVVRAEQWAEIDSKFVELKSKYELEHNAELHAAWLDAEIKEQDRIPNFVAMTSAARRTAVQTLWDARSKEAAKKKEDRKWLKRQIKGLSPYFHLTYSDRRRFLEDCCDLLKSQDEACLVVKAIDTECNKESDLTFISAFRDFFWAFQRFLKTKTASHPASREMGLLVHDTCDKTMLAKTVVQVLGDAPIKIKGEPRTICPAPLFVDSQHTSMVQFADLCAYAVRSYLDGKGEHLFNRIESLFDYANHTSNKPSCDCRICARYL